MMSEDRKRQVATTRARHGDDFYVGIGKKSKGGGFNDPEVAKRAASKRWANKRKIRDDAVSNDE